MITCKTNEGFEYAKKAINHLNYEEKVEIDTETQKIRAINDNIFLEQKIIKVAKVFIKISKNNDLCICPRCNGTGEYSYNISWGNTCMKCKGAGYTFKG